MSMFWKCKSFVTPENAKIYVLYVLTCLSAPKRCFVLFLFLLFCFVFLFHAHANVLPPCLMRRDISSMLMPMSY